MVDRIERELVIPATTAEVWDVVTGPGWLADQVELDLVPGGDAEFTSADEIRTGWVEEALAPDDAQGSGRLVFWWAADAEPATRVEVLIEAHGPAWTHVRVLEERPLEVLDVIGIPLPGTGEASRGPQMLSLV